MTKRLVTGATVCWLMASAGLAALISLQINSEISLTSPVTAAPSKAAPEQDEHLKDPIVDHLPADALQLIVERPLFSWSRRPPFSPPLEQEATEPLSRKQPLSAKLAGTMLAGTTRMALFTHPSKGLLRLGEGRNIDGWLIKEVREDAVRLEQGDDVTLLKLRKGDSQKERPSLSGVKKPVSVNKTDPPVGTIEGDKPVTKASAN